MIIGSAALNHYYPEFPREPKDIDIVAWDLEDKKHLESIHKDTFKRVEVLINPVILKYVKDNYGYIPEYLPIELLMTLKVSHSLWFLENGSFTKHLWDISFLKEKGHELYWDLFYNLFEYWEGVHGKRKSSDLSLSAEEFFDNAIKYPIPHDDLHELLIKHPHFKGQERPTYTKILKDGCEVDVCMEKFNNLSHQEKLNIVFEEVAVMQLERFKNLHWRQGYDRMLTKFIVNHAKIEEAVWIILNHKEILTNPPFNHIKFLEDAIRDLKS